MTVSPSREKVRSATVPIGALTGQRPGSNEAGRQGTTAHYTKSPPLKEKRSEVNAVWHGDRSWADPRARRHQ